MLLPVLDLRLNVQSGAPCGPAFARTPTFQIL